MMEPMHDSTTDQTAVPVLFAIPFDALESSQFVSTTGTFCVSDLSQSCPALITIRNSTCRFSEQPRAVPISNSIRNLRPSMSGRRIVIWCYATRESRRNCCPAAASGSSLRGPQLAYGHHCYRILVSFCRGLLRSRAEGVSRVCAGDYGPICAVADLGCAGFVALSQCGYRRFQRADSSRWTARHWQTEIARGRGRAAIHDAGVHVGLAHNVSKNVVVESRYATKLTVGRGISGTLASATVIDELAAALQLGSNTDSHK